MDILMCTVKTTDYVCWDLESSRCFMNSSFIVIVILFYSVPDASVMVLSS